MFKRAVKRQKKQELDEKLGISELVRGAEIDSDESDDESDDLSESGGEGSDNSEDLSEGSNDDNDDNDNEEVDHDDDDDDDIDESDDENDEMLEVNNETAISEPIYGKLPKSSCFICPGKQFKSEDIVKNHIDSRAHTRRLNRLRLKIEDGSIKLNDNIKISIKSMDDNNNQEKKDDQKDNNDKQLSNKSKRKMESKKIAKQKRLSRLSNKNEKSEKLLPIPKDEIEIKQSKEVDENLLIKRKARRERKKANKLLHNKKRKIN